MTEHEANDLNLRIAEALGFRFEEFADKLRIMTPRPSEQWKQEAFGAVLVPKNSKYPYETTFDIGLRDWARNTDAAIKLSTSDPNTILVEPSPVGYVATLKAYRDRVIEEFVADASTIAEAVCRAWLAWKEGQK